MRIRGRLLTAVAVVYLTASASAEGPIVPSDRIVKKVALKPGTPIVVEAPSPKTRFAVVFEDDGVTGYFYGLDPSREEQPILDALQVYDVERVADRDRASSLEIGWSSSGEQALLLVNSEPHAIFDFHGKRGYCRSGFPPPSREWTEHSHAWDDSALEFFR